MSARLLTVEDVMARLDVSRRHVLDELRRNNLRGSKLSGKAGWRIEEDDLAAYLAAKANVRPVRRSA